jgi:excisionase family DNA binding protein
MATNVTLRSNWGIEPASNGRRMRVAPTLDEYAGDSDLGELADGPDYDAFAATTPAMLMPATVGRAQSMGSVAHNSTQANVEEAVLVRCEPLIDAERAAEILKLHPKTVKRLVQEGQLPGFRIGRVWRFRESSLDDWMRSQLQRLPASPKQSPAPPIR